MFLKLKKKKKENCVVMLLFLTFWVESRCYCIVLFEFFFYNRV